MVPHKKLKNHKNFCQDLNVATLIGTDISCVFLEILESFHHIDRCNNLTHDYVGAMRQNGTSYFLVAGYMHGEKT